MHFIMQSRLFKICEIHTNNTFYFFLFGGRGGGCKGTDYYNKGSKENDISAL